MDINYSQIECQNCHAIISKEDEFCIHCGSKTNETNIELKNKAVNDEHKAVSKAANWILAVGILFAVSGTIFGIIQYYQVKDSNKQITNILTETKKGTSVQQVNVTDNESKYSEVIGILVINYILAIIMIGLYFWAKNNPLPPIILALCIYLVLIVLNGILEPESIFRGLLIKILFIGALFKGLRAALNERKVMAV